MSQYPKACIIGAGISGLSTAKALKDKGVPFDCFEMSDQVGGNWVFKNRNGRSSSTPPRSACSSTTSRSA
jgi:cation diffusion facilitator CzcD-associated flavoprotein CzcO